MTALARPGAASDPIQSCSACLRRGHLLGVLSGRITGLLASRAPRVPELFALEDRELVRAIGGGNVAGALEFLDRFDADRAAEQLRHQRVGAVCRHAPAYPTALRALGDAPALLFAIGDLGLLDTLRVEPAVAIVGARRASPYGLEMSYSLGRGLGAAGVPVVSGLALGIDAAAHRGCLDAGGRPIAVLAGGPDIPYPRTHARLHERIRARGLVVAEQPPGQRSYRWGFPARNRIMAGLSTTTVVVEAAAESGSMITATLAEQLGRTVAAVPGHATAAVAKGSNALLKDGALVVTGAQDLLDDLFGTGERRVAPATPVPAGVVDRAILEAMEAGLGIDAICAAAGLPAREVRVALARLEGSGHLRRDSLGAYVRTGAAA